MATTRLDPMTLPAFAPQEWQMLYGERVALEGLLAQIKPRLAIEIGTAEGGSLRRIAAHSDEVHSFDVAPPPHDLAGLENVTFHTGDSHRLLGEYLARIAAEEESIDFVLIDGDHSADGVRRDIIDVLESNAVTRAVIVLHDTLNPEVRQGIGAAHISEHDKVVLFEPDMVPGYLARNEPYRLQLWGGLGLIVVDAEHRRHAPGSVRDDRFHELFHVLRPTVEVMQMIEARGTALNSLQGEEVEAELRSAVIERSRAWQLVLGYRRLRDRARAGVGQVRSQRSAESDVHPGPAATTLGTGLREVLDAERAVMPADVYAIRSMLSYDERMLLHWAARTAGSGAVVDLGAFLGGSTLALATGAADRGGTVYSYDRFVLSGDWERPWLPEAADVAVGDSTRPVFEANVARVRDRIVIREGEVEAHGWSDGPIAVLFIDIAKSWSTGDFIWRTFLPALVPGSLVIQQDLVHWGHPWCAIIMEYLAPHFEYLGWVWYGSAVYRCRRPIESVPMRLLDELACEEMVELVDRAAARVGEPAAAMVRMSAVQVYGTFGRFDDARECVQRTRASYRDEDVPHIEEGFEYLGRWIADVEAGRIVIGESPGPVRGDRRSDGRLGVSPATDTPLRPPPA